MYSFTIYSNEFKTFEKPQKTIEHYSTTNVHFLEPSLEDFVVDKTLEEIGFEDNIPEVHEPIKALSATLVGDSESELSDETARIVGIKRKKERKQREIIKKPKEIDLIDKFKKEGTITKVFYKNEHFTFSVQHIVI